MNWTPICVGVTAGSLLYLVPTLLTFDVVWPHLTAWARVRRAAQIVIASVLCTVGALYLVNHP